MQRRRRPLSRKRTVHHNARHAASHVMRAAPRVSLGGSEAPLSYRTEIADRRPVLCAMNRIPCALSARLPPAGYDHTC